MAETQFQANRDAHISRLDDDAEASRPQVPTGDQQIPQALLSEDLRLLFLRAVVASSTLTTGLMLYLLLHPQLSYLLRTQTDEGTLKMVFSCTVLTGLTTAHHIGTYVFIVTSCLDVH